MWHSNEVRPFGSLYSVWPLWFRPFFDDSFEHWFVMSSNLFGDMKVNWRQCGSHMLIVTCWNLRVHVTSKSYLKIANPQQTKPVKHCLKTQDFRTAETQLKPNESGSQWFQLRFCNCGYLPMVSVSFSKVSATFPHSREILGPESNEKSSTIVKSPQL